MRGRLGLGWMALGVLMPGGGVAAYSPLHRAARDGDTQTAVLVMSCFHPPDRASRADP